MSYPEDYIATADLVTTGYYQLQAVKHKTAGTQFLLKKYLRLDTQQLAGLRGAVDLARELKLDVLLEPVEFFEQGLQASILYSHFPAISLRHFLQQNIKLNITQSVALARRLVMLLDGFHRRGWILKNICPENILVDAKTLECKLSDLRKATRVFKKEKNLIYQKSDILELLYLSPEQTGRIGLLTDHRADLYALGIIFYEMLTGQLPFPFTDPVEVIHAHLAIPPRELTLLQPAIPKAMNDIVMKLLAKNPEERYQSCEGLLYDLDRAGFLSSTVESFKLGTRDKITKLIPTARMIGRKRELEILEQAYQKAVKGRKQAVYIRGYSGVGKTRIVQEFYRDKLAQGVPMVSSKFDELQRATPYGALVSAMRNLIRKLLREDDEQLAYWKNRLISQLKNNGEIIVEVVPELEVMLGKQELLNALPPEEAQKRFQQTFINFISTFTSDEHSLILFIDDLQWADIASIRLLELILMEESVKNFLFIGAYRENEVDPTHPLAVSIKKQNSWVNLHDLAISSLNKDEISEIILQTMHHPVLRSSEFINRIFQKTGGNTFFTIQLFTSLFEEKLLELNDDGVWDWNEKVLQDTGISLNVVDFLVEKIENLGPGLKHLLLIASCLGDVFDLNTLAKIAAEKRNAVALELSVAVNLGYIISLDENLDAFFKTVSDIGEKELSALANTRFRFSHDRIRQAALMLVNASELASLNLKAARIKTTTLQSAEIEVETFYIANHFNAAASLIQDEREQRQLIDFNYRAGVKARKASAYDAAVKYFGEVISHINFEEHYELLYDVYLQQAECRYLTGKYEEAERDLNMLFNAGKSRIDKLNTLFIKVYLYNIQDKKREAIEAGRTGYRLFNIYMPRSKPLVMLLLLKDVFIAGLKIPEKKIDQLLQRPLMKDPELIRLQEFLLAMAPTIYQYDQNLFAWNIMRMLFASLKHGNNGISSFSYIGYGMMVSQLFGKYRMGKKLADVSLQLNNQLGYTALKWKVRLSYYNFVHHWTDPIRPEINAILDVENGAFANGDPIFAGYAIFIYHQKKFALGFALKELQESFENYLKIVDQRHDVETRRFLESYYYAIRCLRGLEKDTHQLGQLNAPLVLKESIASSSFTVVADTAIAYMSTLYLFGHIDMALDNYLRGAKYMSFIQQRYEFAEFNFYGLLICASAYEKKLPQASQLMRRMKKHLKLLQHWKNHCPANFEPQYLIASAEYARINGEGLKAISLFEQAIQRSEQFGFVNYKALASELAGKYHFGTGNTFIAQTYLDNSRKLWQHWGAVAKVEDLEKNYPGIFGTSILETQSTQELQDANVEGMDLTMLMKATHAVNSEKDIDSLVEQLMKAIIHYSGADNGYLLVKTGADLVVKARYNFNTGMETVDLFADNNMLPMSIIKYVVRLKEPLILNQAASSPDYANTPYFKTNAPKSLIAYPIVKQGEVFGVLYLENFQQEAVFDEKKINVLSLISAQVAVSLDNAFLYQNLESKVLERTVAIELEKGKVDQMLENILPKASIEELKRTGKTTAQKFDNVTVLIADIKGFTKIAEKLSPEELINKIDFYFRSFDEIMVKYGLEKIKTIGDAYVAMGGLNGDAAAGALHMVEAALDMQDCIQKENVGVQESDMLEMRIGIHTGTVIAGVVGIKKFQYDIWGDTVNIAARMEQESETGRVNISKETWMLIQDKISATYRGKIDAKNKGLLDMYFVEKLI